MCSLVSGHQTLLRRRIGTLIAPEHIARMDPHVGGQMVLVFGGKTTMAASQIFFSRMDQEMGVQA